jgi:hypothetical protein
MTPDLSGHVTGGGPTMNQARSDQSTERPDALTVHEVGDPDVDFGLRVDWQSEAVRMEAAEFLVATRSQQERRLRIARDLDTLRVLEHPGP